MKIFVYILCFILSAPLHANISKRDFQALLKNFQQEFRDLALGQNEKLVVYDGYDSPDLDNAYSRRWDREAQILVYGGLARVPEVTVTELGLILCHELGHLYGGFPWDPGTSKLSVEGQADYFATNKCFARILKFLPLNNWQFNSEVLSICGADLNCQKTLETSLRLSWYFSQRWGQEKPSLTKHDDTVVPTTLVGYPELVQCRLDTFKSGFSGETRPSCWFAASDD
jgi:hypothetical protein